MGNRQNLDRFVGYPRPTVHDVSRIECSRLLESAASVTARHKPIESAGDYENHALIVLSPFRRGAVEIAILPYHNVPKGLRSVRAAKIVERDVSPAAVSRWAQFEHRPELIGTVTASGSIKITRSINH